MSTALKPETRRLMSPKSYRAIDAEPAVAIT